MLAILLVILGIILFFVGIFAPTRARRIKHKTKKHFIPIEEKTERAPGWLSYVFKGPFWTTRKVVQHSTNKGRAVRKKLPF